MADLFLDARINQEGALRDVERIRQNSQQILNRNKLVARLDLRGFELPLGRITGKVGEFEKSLDAAGARLLAFGAANAILFKTVEGFKELAEQSIKVEKTLAEINVLFRGTSENLARFGSEIFQVAKNTQQVFDTVAAAALELARQGLSAEETARRLNDSLILTRLSGQDAATSVASLTAAINGFGEGLLKSTEINDKFVAVSNNFAVSTADLSNAVARTGEVAREAGLEFGQLLGLVAATQQQTARGGNVIGNGLKTIFTRIQRSSTVEALERVGVVVKDNNDNLLSGIQILQNYAASYDKLGASTRRSLDEQIAGVFQINTLKAIINDLTKEVSLYERAQSVSANSAGEAEKANESLNKTLSAQINILKLNTQELSQRIGDVALAPSVRTIVEGVSGIFKNLSDSIGGQDTGETFGKQFLEGLGNVFGGPVLGAAFGIIIKLVRVLSDQAGKYVNNLLFTNKKLEEQKALEQQVLDILVKDQVLIDNILAGRTNIQTATKAVRDLILEENRALAEQLILAQKIAQSLTNPASAAVIGRAVGGKTKSVPNAADPLSDAIEREKRSVPARLIYVDSDPRLKSPDNPLGLGVFNSRDEPNGAKQGVDRIVRQGKNPKLSGFQKSFVPNFQVPQTFKPEQLRGNIGGDINKILKQLGFSTSGGTKTTRLTNAINQVLQNTYDAYRENDKNAQKIARESLKLLTESVKSPPLKTQINDFEKRIIRHSQDQLREEEKQLKAERQKTRLAESQLRQQARAASLARFGSRIKGLGTRLQDKALPLAFSGSLLSGFLPQDGAAGTLSNIFNSTTTGAFAGAGFGGIGALIGGGLGAIVGILSSQTDQYKKSLEELAKSASDTISKNKSLLDSTIAYSDAQKTLISQIEDGADSGKIEKLTDQLNQFFNNIDDFEVRQRLIDAGGDQKLIDEVVKSVNEQTKASDILAGATLSLAEVAQPRGREGSSQQNALSPIASQIARGFESLSLDELRGELEFLTTQRSLGDKSSSQIIADTLNFLPAFEELDDEIKTFVNKLGKDSELFFTLLIKNLEQQIDLRDQTYTTTPRIQNNETQLARELETVIRNLIFGNNLSNVTNQSRSDLQTQRNDVINSNAFGLSREAQLQRQSNVRIINEQIKLRTSFESILNETKNSLISLIGKNVTVTEDNSEQISELLKSVATSKNQEELSENLESIKKLTTEDSFNEAIDILSNSRLEQEKQNLSLNNLVKIEGENLKGQLEQIRLQKEQSSLGGNASLNSREFIDNFRRLTNRGRVLQNSPFERTQQTGRSIQTQALSETFQAFPFLTQENLSDSQRKIIVTSLKEQLQEVNRALGGNFLSPERIQDIISTQFDQLFRKETFTNQVTSGIDSSQINNYIREVRDVVVSEGLFDEKTFAENFAKIFGAQTASNVARKQASELNSRIGETENQISVLQNQIDQQRRLVLEARNKRFSDIEGIFDGGSKNNNPSGVRFTEALRRSLGISIGQGLNSELGIASSDADQLADELEKISKSFGEAEVTIVGFTEKVVPLLREKFPEKSGKFSDEDLRENITSLLNSNIDRENFQNPSNLISSLGQENLARIEEKNEEEINRLKGNLEELKAEAENTQRAINTIRDSMNNLANPVDQLSEEFSGVENTAISSIKALKNLNDLTSTSIDKAKEEIQIKNQELSLYDQSKDIFRSFFDALTGVGENLLTLEDRTILVGRALRSDLSDTLLDIVLDSKNAGEALKNLGLSLLKNIADQATQEFTNRALQAAVSAAGSFFHLGGQVKGYAEGNTVTGPSGRDKVLAALTAGEVVIRKPVVDKFGASYFEQINNTGQIPERKYRGGVVGYQNGGTVKTNSFTGGVSSIMITTNINDSRTETNSRRESASDNELAKNLEKKMRQVAQEEVLADNRRRKTYRQ